MSIENLTLAITLLLLADRILRTLAPITATPLDDEAVKAVDKAKDWARTMSPAIYAIVEQLAATGKIPKADKAQAFFVELAEAYRRSTGNSLPAQAHAEAEILAKGLAAADKMAKGNPQTAPAAPN